MTEFFFNIHPHPTPLPSYEGEGSKSKIHPALPAPARDFAGASLFLKRKLKTKDMIAALRFTVTV
jgi:hypothetical protein